jgi:hypothetical protein
MDDWTKETAIASIVADDLRPSRGGLRSHIHKRIRRGLFAGLVVLGEDGLATAAAPEGASDRVTAKSLRGEVSDLSWLLQQPGGQRDALELLHAIEPASVVPIDVTLSTEHLRALSLVLACCPVPEAVAKRVAPALERLLYFNPGYNEIREDIPRWFLAVVAVVQHHARLGVALELADILAAVTRIVGRESMRPEMLNPSPKHLREAARRLKLLRVAKARAGGARRDDMTPSPVSAWTAAREIADAFGYPKSMIPDRAGYARKRPSSLKREPKRRTGPATKRPSSKR